MREVVGALDADVEVVAIDDARDPDRAGAAIRSLVAAPGCIGVVGPKNSGSALAAAPIAAAAGLPLVLPCATADRLTGTAGTTFRLCAPDSATAAAAVDLAIEVRIDILAVLADDTEYGRYLAETVRSAAKAVGLATRGDVAGADGAFLAMGEVEQATLMVELRAGGFTGQFVSAEGGPHAPLPDLAHGAAEGAWLLYPGRPVASRTVYAAEAADAARVLLAGAGDVTAIRSNIVDGETGTIRFTPAGERDGATVSRYRVVDGEACLITS